MPEKNADNFRAINPIYLGRDRGEEVIPHGWVVVALRDDGLRHLYLADQTGVHADPPTIPQHLCWVECRERSHGFFSREAATTASERMSRADNFNVCVAYSDGTNLYYEETIANWAAKIRHRTTGEAKDKTYA